VEVTALSSSASAVAERDVEVADLLVHVSERGSGPPIVVLHRSTGPLWAPFHDRLATSGAVLAPDTPGYGRSTRPVNARHPSHLAILLHQMLDAEERDGVHLVGLGMGGWIAAEMAAMNQRRLASLTLVGAAGIAPREGFIHDPMTESFTAYVRQGFRDDAAFEAVFGAEPVQDVVDLWDYSREMTARVTWKPWMWSLQLPDLLRGVRTPALLVWGGEDRIVPRDSAHQYAESLPNARLEIVGGAGHVVELEQPEALAVLVAEHVAAAAR
jgi:pimeloyl-ACP methyl ester carboxylesterase